MKEKYEILKDAEKEISQNKKAALLESDRRREEIIAKFPEYGELENKIRKNGLQMMKLAGLGIKSKAEIEALDKENRAYDGEMKKILTSNGFSEDYISKTDSCAKCEDTGYVFDELGRQVMCDCLKGVCAKYFLEESEIPAKHSLSEFNINLFGEKDRELAEKIKSFVGDIINNPEKPVNCILMGKPGTGKSFVSEIIGTELAKKGKYVLYITVTSLLQTLMYYGEDEVLLSRRDSALRIVREADLLILDDLGTEKVTASRLDIIMGVIDSRTSRENKSTIVSSNLSLKEISEIYGERLFSRLSAMKIVNFKFEDTKDLRILTK